MNLDINLLIPTQHKIRNPKNVLQMIDHVKNKGLFDKKSIENYSKKHDIKYSGLIKIAKFEDDKLFIEDGHHRICAIWHSGRDFLFPTEYLFMNWTYNQFTELNQDAISTGWLTPFDPREEVRIADFFAFKNNIPKDPNEAMKYIKTAWDNKEYTESRKIHHIKDIDFQI